MLCFASRLHFCFIHVPYVATYSYRPRQYSTYMEEDIVPACKKLRTKEIIRTKKRTKIDESCVAKCCLVFAKIEAIDFKKKG